MKAADSGAESRAERNEVSRVDESGPGGAHGRARSLVGGIGSVEYRMEGSCDLFWEWLQYECRTVTRAASGGTGP